MTKTFAIVNFKGGVGKTTIAVNLAAALANKGRRVLLIDTDMQCNTTDSFQVDYDFTLYDVFYGVKKLNEVIVPVRKNLDLVPSDPKMQNAANFIVGLPAREFILRKALKTIPEGTYDYIFIDNNPAFTVITQNSIAAASDLIIPVELEHYAMQGIVKMMDQLFEFCKAIDHKIHVAMVIPMKVDRRFSTTEHYIESLKRHFKDRLYSAVRTDANVSKAQGFRMTIFEYDPRSKAAEDFQYIADRIDQEVKENYV
jgi:chromosome partitioning protein